MAQRLIPNRSFRQQRGLGLVELMIAGTLSVIIGIILFQLMMGANRSGNRIGSMSEAQENARFAIHWLADHIAAGGYNPFSEVAPDSIVMAACISNATPPAANAHCSIDNTDAPDQIAIERVSDNGLTCTGASLADLGVTETDMVVDVFWVERDSGSGDDEYDDLLRCATYTSSGTLLDSAQTLTSGIEDLQLLYATENSHGFVALADISDVSEISAVRLAILARGYSDAARLTGTRSYLRLNADPLRFSDGVPRLMFEDTVYLMNSENVVADSSE